MKSFFNFIKESSQDVWDELFYLFISEYEEDDDLAKFFKEFKKLTKQFLKDNNITTTKQVRLTTSDSETMELWYRGVAIDIEEDESIEKICGKGFMQRGDAWCEDMSSWRYKDGKLYFSAQTSAYGNGDYFDGCFSKI